MKNRKSKKILLSVIGIAILIVAVVGVSFAFFNYTRTGTENTLSVGRISFNTNQTETINLSNLFPIDVTNGIPNDDTKVGTFELEITGDTDYVGGIEYLVSAVNTHVTTSTGQIVPISLDISVEGLGTYENNYFTERENKNSKIYKRLSGNGIMGDGNLLVGYIPQNTTLGTSGGINGKITIKAYLDANKIAISDTYDGNETDLMGTTNEWVNGRVVLTTSEWNALQSNGISFQIKVEANEDIWVEETLYDVVERQTVMDNIQSTYVSSSTGIDFSQISSDTNGKGVYTFSSTANDAYPVMYYRGAVTNNNVLFANKCWKMVRTTDTGGVKLIYNGENKGTEETPNCDNTGASTAITLNIEGTPTTTFMFNENIDSLAYNGYMYGTVYSMTNGAVSDTENTYFGTMFTYDTINRVYTLTNAKKGIDAYHHYTCDLTTENGTCSSIKYYFSYYTNSAGNHYFYFTLNDGKSIEDAISEMQANTTNSSAKDKIDTWYAANIANNTNYLNKIEDTIWCNDRDISDVAGFNPNGGSFGSNNLIYMSNNRIYNMYEPSLKCRKNDSFTMSIGRGNGKLTYPVALLTIDEVIFAGGNTTTSSTFYLKNGVNTWALSPDVFTSEGGARFVRIASSGSLISVYSNKKASLRPSISLKNDTAIVDNDADGTVSKPYVIK